MRSHHLVSLLVLAAACGREPRPAATAHSATANFGGTGTFVSAVPVLNRDGKAVPGKGAPLGDRTHIQALSLDADTVVIEMVASGPSDPACCPSDTLTQRFHLVGDSLALLP